MNLIMTLKINVFHTLGLFSILGFLVRQQSLSLSMAACYNEICHIKTISSWLSPSVDMMFMTKLCLAVSKVRLLYAVICNKQEGKFKPGSGQLYIHTMQRKSEPDANTYSFSRVKKNNKAKSLHESKAWTIHKEEISILMHTISTLPCYLLFS